jgi:hypothetical protein
MKNIFLDFLSIWGDRNTIYKSRDSGNPIRIKANITCKDVPIWWSFSYQSNFEQRLIGATTTCHQPSEIGGPEPEKPISMFDDGVQGVRMNHYPPCEQANKVMGLTPHSDATGLTLLIRFDSYTTPSQQPLTWGWAPVCEVHPHVRGYCVVVVLVL